MRQYTGNLKKMGTTLTDDGVVEYTLALDEADVKMNPLLGKHLKWDYTGEIHCIKCGRLTRKSFGQGFCYSCFTTAPEAEECVLRPELCKAQWGIARDLDFARAHCLQPHFVYLAHTGALKVGVTRWSQIPTRWIDQGATAAVKLCRTPNRHIAGVIETTLKQHFSDKTSWRKMLSRATADANELINARDTALESLPPELKQYALPEEKVFTIHYPVQDWPGNMEQVNFDRQKQVEGVLNGIKGQYLFMGENQVLNIRRYSGYRLQLSLDI